MNLSGSFKPRKMKEIELTVLNRDIDMVIEFLGRRAVIHLIEDHGITQQDHSEELNLVPSWPGVNAPAEASLKHIHENLDRLSKAASWLGLSLPAEPYEDSLFPGEADEVLSDTIIQTVSGLSSRELELDDEKRKINDALNEAKAFANLNAPFTDLDQLSFLTLRIGRLDYKRQEELKHNLADRAVIIPLGPAGNAAEPEAAGSGAAGSEKSRVSPQAGDRTSGRFLMAASRKGRFALDSELKKANFVPIAIPEGYKGVPSELLSGLEERLKEVNRELGEIGDKRVLFREEYGDSLRAITASFIMAGICGRLKARLKATSNVYLLSGWIPADKVQPLLEDLEKLTEGRIAVRSYNPDELETVKEGKEKVPVSLDHGAFVKGFETLVFSYGAPLYGTIDPTPLVALFFTVLFGIMFGDLGQGMVLFILGFLTGKHGPAFLSRFRKFSVPLIAVGISSMIMGILEGSFFATETLLVAPTRALTSFLLGHPMDRFIVIMPLPEKGGSLLKLFYFLGFTIGVGILLNSAGLILNMVNQFFLKKYEKAIFAKTGLAGILLLWYAVFISVRFILALVKPEVHPFSFRWYDFAGLIVPLAGIFLGPAIWRLLTGKRPVFAEGFMVFFVEGFVEVIETISSNVSNTVSFLRVGAFALSHAVLSYIVFRFVEEVSASSMGPAAGVVSGLAILIIGNAVIILLEGMIVAIQVVRLQYYEFFSKFFVETGIEFSPFRFNRSNH